MAIASTDAEVHYPESDGKPMAETQQHRLVMTSVIQCLEDWFADDPTVYVSGNMFLYYVEGQPKFNVSPDVMVVRGVDGRLIRSTYKTWEEGGKTPDLVVEVTSSSTSREDKRKKYRLYQDELKVREYILFDPYGEWLRPPLQGYRLVKGEYQSIEAVGGRLPSEVLGLHFEREGEDLRLFNPATGVRLPTRLEAKQRAEQETLRKDAELRRKDEVISRKDEVISRKDEVISRKDEIIRQTETENERLQRKIEELEAAMKRRGSDADQ